MTVKKKVSLNENFQSLLRNEFSRRCRVNSKYSVRAFAKSAELDSSTMSKILSGKRSVSESMIEKISKKLGINITANTLQQQNSYQQMNADAFAVISDWYHYAILDLVQLDSFENNSQWIADKLSISKAEARHAVDRLLRLGFLKEETNQLKKSTSFFSNYAEGETSSAHKEYQRQVIQKALQAVDLCDDNKKDITSITIATSEKKLKQAKEKIKNFRRELCHFMEEEDKESIYHLTIQLYPVTK